MKKLNISTELERRHEGDGWGLHVTWAEPGTRCAWYFRRRLWEHEPTEADYVAVAGVLTDALAEQQMIQGTQERRYAMEQEGIIPEAIIHRPDYGPDEATGHGRY